MKFALPLAALAAATFAGDAFAQIERYELGRRVRMFERAFAAADPKTRAARSVEYAKTAVSSFFGMQLGAAGKALSQGTRALRKSGEITPMQRFAESLQLIPDARLFDAKAASIGYRIRTFYRVDVEAPENASIEVHLMRDSSLAKSREPLDGNRLDGSLELPKGLRPGSYTLRAMLVTTDQSHEIARVHVSLVADLEARLARAKAAVEKLGKGHRYWTIRLQLDHLKALTRRRALETDFQAHQILAQIESDLTAADQPLRRTAGEHWLRVVIPAQGRSREQRAVVRAEIPKGLAADERAPLVLALHGAGGTENLFFDGYGDGAIRRFTKQRKWVLVAPRLGFTSRPDMPRLVEQLATILPIDPNKVFLVGHSMGAGAAVTAACRTPSAFRGVVAFGGGGRVRPSAKLKALPFFVSTGEADFARAGAQRLHRTLGKAGVSSKYREYPDIEHLMIVQVGLEDAFAFLDGCAGKK